MKHQLAGQHAAVGRFEEAAALVSEAIGFDASQADFYVLLAQAYLELNKPASAESAIRTAWQIGADAPDLHYYMGVIHEERNQLEKAAEQYRAARAMNGRDVDYLVAEAECLVAVGRPEESLTLLDQFADAYDDQQTIFVLGGRIALLLDDSEGAVRRLSRAMAAGSENTSLSRDMGTTFAQCGRCREAVPLLRSVVRDSDGQTDGTALRWLAACLLATNDFAGAKDALAEYVLSNPGDGAAWLLWAKVSLLEGDLAAAARGVNQARQTLVGDRELLITEAALHWRRERADEALVILDQLIASDADFAEGFCLRGEILLRQGDLSAAKGAFQAALRAAPDTSCALSGLASLSDAD